MRQTGPNWQAKRRIVAVAVFIAIAGFLFISERASSTFVGEPQRGQKQTRHRRRAPRSEKVADKYSNFTHHTHGKDSEYPKARDLKCNSCHTIPSATQPDSIADAGKPGIVRGYPYHDACFRCHDKDIYRGDRPAICTDCHTRVSPRATARDVYSQFPRQVDLILRQFPGYFPHEKHRQAISDLKKVADLKQVSCADCHKKDERTPVAFLVGGDEKTLTAATGTFETSPDLPNYPPSAHTSCFGCHWETNDETKKPSKDNCAGCHRAQKEFADQKHPKKDSLLSLMSVLWFKDWPRDWPRRVSLKFRHERKEHSGGCTTCHANIVKTATLDIPDVPILSCFKCHKSEKPKIYEEMEAEDEDTKEGRNNDAASKAGKHTCSGCHTTLIGSAPPPCSHFKLDEDKYLTGDYPKISERCKE